MWKVYLEYFRYIWYFLFFFKNIFGIIQVLFSGIFGISVNCVVRSMIYQCEKFIWYISDTFGIFVNCVVKSMIYQCEKFIWYISDIFGIFVNSVVRSMIYQVSERLTAIWRSVNPHPSTNTTKERRMENFFTKNTKETFGHQLTQPR